MRCSAPNHLHALALIQRASAAPSSHNTQPWCFHATDTSIDLYADRARRLPVNDPDDRELTISCGCALLNLRVAAEQHFAVRVQLLPDPRQPDWLARIQLQIPERPILASACTLAGFIEHRRSYRGPFAAREIPAAIRAELETAARTEGAWLRPLSAEERERIAAWTVVGDVRQWCDPAWRRELAAWLRTPGHGDGLVVPAPLRPLAHWAVARFDFGRIVAARDRRRVLLAPWLAVLGTAGDRPPDWLHAGQALQRVLLLACRHGLQASFMNQAIQISDLRSRVAELVDGAHPQVLLQLGYPLRESPRVPRRPLTEIVIDPAASGSDCADRATAPGSIPA